MRIETSKIKVLDGQNRDNSDKSIIQSVEKEGVLVPLLVYQDKENPESYILVAGHRRLASAIHFGLKDVPVELITEDQSEKARALENLDRKGLHPLDEAMEIRTLQSQGYDNSVISAMLGIGISKLRRRSQLNNLIPEVREDFKQGKMNAAVAEEYSVMDPKDQKAVWKEVHDRGWGSTSPRDVREEYLRSRGFSLSECPETFLKMSPSCAKCPKNLAADDVLFEGSDGSCTDGKCYCGKISRLMEKEGITSLCASEYTSDKKRIELLNKSGISAAIDRNYWRYNSKKDEKFKVPKMSIYGKVLYDIAAEKPKEVNPDAAERMKELEKLYKNDLKELYANLQKMVFEHVDAYMSKKHKDERFPDNDERVVLAKRVLSDNDMALRVFITGRQISPKEDPMQGADNRKIFALALFLIATECQRYCVVNPERVDLSYSKLLLPKSMEIEDLFQLKTSKAKKKVLELQQEMEGYLKEYRELSK